MPKFSFLNHAELFMSENYISQLHGNAQKSWNKKIKVLQLENVTAFIEQFVIWTIKRKVKKHSKDIELQQTVKYIHEKLSIDGDDLDPKYVFSF